MFTIIFDLYVFSNYFLQIYSENFCFENSFLFVIYSSMYTEAAMLFVCVRISDIKNPLLLQEEDFFTNTYIHLVLKEYRIQQKQSTLQSKFLRRLKYKEA